MMPLIGLCAVCRPKTSAPLPPPGLSLDFPPRRKSSSTVRPSRGHPTTQSLLVSSPPVGRLGPQTGVAIGRHAHLTPTDQGWRVGECHRGRARPGVFRANTIDTRNTPFSRPNMPSMVLPRPRNQHRIRSGSVHRRAPHQQLSPPFCSNPAESRGKLPLMQHTGRSLFSHRMFCYFLVFAGTSPVSVFCLSCRFLIQTVLVSLVSPISYLRFLGYVIFGYLYFSLLPSLFVVNSFCPWASRGQHLAPFAFPSLLSPLCAVHPVDGYCSCLM